jgi:hypothetical protein
MSDSLVRQPNDPEWHCRVPYRPSRVPTRLGCVAIRSYPRISRR